MDDRAKAIIALRDKELAKQSNFRNLWQETADLIFPRENQITSEHTPGEDKTRKVYDTTAIQDSQDMASGLSAALIPTGQKFFGLTVEDEDLLADDRVRRYVMRATEITHKNLFESNFMLQFNETLRSMVVFGTGNLYSEWDARMGRLNYKDYDISLYQIKQDSHGAVDTVILSFELTARQAIQEYGQEKVGEKIRKDATALETESNLHPFIKVVRPRDSLNPLFRDNRNMPWESVTVDVKGLAIVEETGYEEFPFAVARWMKSSNEKYGRGQGTECLADVKVMQVITKDFIDCGNRWNSPPLEVLDTYEGPVDVTPNALNRVPQHETIAVLDQRALGNFPITKEMLEYQQAKIHKAFFRDIFVMLTDLTQRMTTVEVRARLQEGLRRLALPVARLQAELLTPVIMRSVLLLIRNGRIPYPPEQLQGRAFGIEYIGPLALALQAEQANGFVQWASVGAQLMPVAPEVMDNINLDRGFRRLGEKFGVHSDDIATMEEVEAKRAARAQMQAQQQKLAAAETAAKTYKAGSAAPEPGSPVEALMAGKA
jgi:hypothetical protein